MARKERVWVGVRQEKSRIRRFWKMKTTPILCNGAVSLSSSTGRLGRST